MHTMKITHVLAATTFIAVAVASPVANANPSDLAACLKANGVAEPPLKHPKGAPPPSAGQAPPTPPTVLHGTQLGVRACNTYLSPTPSR